MPWLSRQGNTFHILITTAMLPSFTDYPVQLVLAFDIKVKQHYSVSGQSEFTAMAPLTEGV